jgi:hypothetical protein
MRGTITRAILLAALAALLLTAAACGGDDEESAAGTQAPAATAEPATTEAADTTSDESEESESTEESGTPNLANEDCRELVGLGTKVSQALGGTGGDIEQTQEFLDAFADDAPEEIREDFRVIAEAYGKIAEALEGVDLTEGAQPDAEALAKLQQLSTELDQVRLEEANDNITAWVDENCGTTGGIGTE